MLIDVSTAVYYYDTILCLYRADSGVAMPTSIFMGKGTLGAEIDITANANTHLSVGVATTVSVMTFQQHYPRLYFLI